MLLSILIFILYISLLGSFIFFYMKYQEVDKELDELYDLYYSLQSQEKTTKKSNVTVLRSVK